MSKPFPEPGAGCREADESAHRACPAFLSVCPPLRLCTAVLATRLMSCGQHLPPVGSSFLHPSPPFQPLTLDRREKDSRERDTLSLDCCLLVRVIEFLGASSIFTIRISNSCFFFTQLFNKLRPTATNSPPWPLNLAFIYPMEGFQNFQLHTVAATGRSHPA